MNPRDLILLTIALAGTLPADEPASPGRAITLHPEDPALHIHVDGVRVAGYVYRDEKILRPYFANVRTPSGTIITRPHPPRPDVDADDHAAMHPGIWLAFGDVGGVDFWRNRGRVVHERFVGELVSGPDRATFTVVHRYETPEGGLVCRETCRHTIARCPSGYLVGYASVFTGPEAFAFGDQEEMGLGVRVATELTEKSGSGRIRSSEGREGAEATWGRPARWCDYGGRLGDRSVGIAVCPHPDRFRPGWWHNRAYGAMVANAFGRRAMKRGEESRHVVEPGEEFRLGYAILVHDTAQPLEPGALDRLFRGFFAREAAAEAEGGD